MNSRGALPVRPTRLRVSIDAICRNVSRLKKISGGRRVMSVVKANCYGLGAAPISRALFMKGLADHFGVATIYEGISLRKAGVTGDMLVLGPLADDEVVTALENGLMPCLYRLSNIDAVERAALALGVTGRVHIKVDSGMGRLGFRLDQIDALIDRLSGSPHISVEGVFSALASADHPDWDQTKRQAAVFGEIVRKLSGAGIQPRLVHMANSAGLLFHPDTRLDIVRPGLAMYGMVPARELDRDGLEPVLRFETNIEQIKTLPPGSEVGYSATYVTKKEEKLAVLPVGYADGLPRILSEKGGFVIVNGKKAPFRGRISMDLSVVSLEGIDADEGSAVTLWGRDGGEEVTPWDWAEMAGTIPYEITCGISPRVPRIYEQDGSEWCEIPFLG